MHHIEIKYYEKIIPDAYHGTDLQSAHNIIEEETFRIGRSAGSFLGDGIYFFENSPWHAKDWARRFKKGKKIAVFLATLNLGICLDIAANKEHRDILRYARNKLIEVDKSKLSPEDIEDGVIINFLSTLISIDSVRGYYITPNKGKIFESSRYYDYAQMIICVRNPKLIVNFQIYYEGK